MGKGKGEEAGTRGALDLSMAGDDESECQGSYLLDHHPLVYLIAHQLGLGDLLIDREETESSWVLTLCGLTALLRQIVVTVLLIRVGVETNRNQQ